MLLEFKNITAGYGGALVLQSVDLAVAEQEFVVLIGPNGAGKSTVLKSIFGLTRVTSGEILFQGHSLLGRTAHELLGLGISYVPQGRLIFPNLSVLDNLRLGGLAIANRRLEEERLRDIFDRFPFLREKKSELGKNLSGGQQQILAIGRALMIQPRLLLLDEPSLGLSPKVQVEIFEKLKELQNEGTTILCVEQNVRLALRFADRGYLLVNGQVRLAGSADEIGQPEIMEQAYLR